jgi:DNA repair protein RecN (Recombination protein N)
MLRELRIRNLAVIEEVTVPLGAGLNVLTGETGAGKSILIDAILLLTGGRAQADLIRSGADTASVEACFEVDPAGAPAALIEEAGHAVQDGQVVVKRELSRAGRNRVFVNDSAATVGLLERLGGLLVEIHGQHEHQRLLGPGHQLEVLDRFAGSEEARGRVEDTVGRWEDTRREADRLREEAREQARQEDLYRFQLSEIDGARLRDGEEEDLRAERRRLQHAERIGAGLREVVGLLHDDDHAAGARLARAMSLLADLARLDPDLATPVEGLGAAQAHLEETLDRVRGLRDRIGADPGRLEEVDERLDVLTRLKRKYGDSVGAILAFREEAAAALERLTRHEEHVEALERQAAALAAEAAVHAGGLSAIRGQAAARLERRLEKELRALGMDQARVQLEIRREPARPGELACGDERWRVGRRGADTVELFLSVNPGETPRPLVTVISGGELSRAMLAVKAILAAADRVPILIFDEIDAGIGGRVADVVGRKLRETAAGRQVLCVTHLAPIAAHAHQHLRVEKRSGRGWTRTSVVPLDQAGIAEELARMLGGEQVTDATRRHARELQRLARRSGQVV